MLGRGLHHVGAPFPQGRQQARYARGSPAIAPTSKSTSKSTSSSTFASASETGPMPRGGSVKEAIFSQQFRVLVGYRKPFAWPESIECGTSLDVFATCGLWVSLALARRNRIPPPKEDKTRQD